MTELIIGKREIHAFAEETSAYGTYATVTRVFGKDTRFTAIQDDADFQEVMASNADSMTISAMEQGVKKFGGTIVSTPQEWRILEFVFGAVAEGGGGGPSYTHTFTFAETLPSFSYQRIRSHSAGDLPVTYLGCKVRKFSLEWNSQSGGKGVYITQNVEFVAQDRITSQAAATVTPPSTQGFKARHVLLTLNSGAVVEIKSGVITIETNLHDATYANSSLGTKIGEPTPQFYRITGRFTVLESNDTYLDLHDTFAAVGGTNTLSFIRTASTDQLVFTLTNLFLKQVPDETNLEGVNTRDIIWQALSTSAVATDAISTY